MKLLIQVFSKLPLFLILLFFSASLHGQPGRDMYNPIDLGYFTGSTPTTDSRDISSYNGYFNNYGQEGRDVWYTFSLSSTSDVNLSTCNTYDFQGTSIYVLNESQYMIYSNSGDGPLCSDGSNASLTAPGLTAGVYYIVVEPWSSQASGYLSLTYGSGPAGGADGPGSSQYNPIEINFPGCSGGSFYDSKNNGPGNGFVNNFLDQQSADVWYKLHIGARSRVSISLCNSDFDTFLHLTDQNTNWINSNDDNGVLCDPSSMSSLEAELDPGTYFIIAEGYRELTGNLNLQVNSTVLNATIPPGSTMANAIDFSQSISNNAGTFTDTKNNSPGNCFGNEIGDPSDDIYYKFTVTAPVQVTVSHCGSNINTYTRLLDNSGNSVAFSYIGQSACQGSPVTLKKNLQPGTYYIVSEGASGYSGEITTRVTLGPVNQNIPRGATLSNAIDVDAVLGMCGGTFTDTKNNADENNFGNDHGDESDDIYYKFTLTAAGEVSISHCNSGFDTKIYLLDVNGTKLYVNDDDGPICSLRNRASLRVTLNPGTYYVVSEGYGSLFGNITTDITLPVVSYPVLEQPVIQGTSQWTYAHYGTRMREYANSDYDLKQCVYWGGPDITCSSALFSLRSKIDNDSVTMQTGKRDTSFAEKTSLAAISDGSVQVNAVSDPTYGCRPLNRSGIWLGQSSSTPVGSWIGIDKDITVPATKTYFIGYAGDDAIKVYIDGKLVGEANRPLNTSDQWENYGYWYVDPVYLSQGSHKLHIEFMCANQIAAAGVELYNNTFSELSNTAEGEGVNIIFSTSWLRDQYVTSFIQMQGSDIKVYKFR